MSDFNLRAEIRNVLATTDMTDPSEIAEKVLNAVPTADLPDVLRLTLRPYVQTFMGRERNTAINFSGTDQNSHEGQAPPVGAGVDLDREDSDHTQHDTHGLTVAASRSWKRDGIRDIFRTRIHVGGQERKLLGDCTVQDITTAAVEREALSRENRAWADRYRKLARRMAQYHVDTVRELSYDTVAAILRGEAA